MKTSRTIVNRLVVSIALISTGIFTLALSWRRWPDVLIDFGRELYVPWQINSGAVLYKDIAYFNGPIAPYINAFLFRIFGTSLMTVALFNIALIAVITILIYRIFYVITDRVTACITSIVFLAVFASSQYAVNGNYNFVCPYSHDITHGVLLSMLALYVFYLYAKDLRARYVFMLGILLGAIFLTKVEVFIACGLAVSASLTAFFIIRKVKGSTVAGAITLLCTAALLPLVGFVSFLSPRMSIPDILSSVTISYRSALNPDIALGAYYKRILGLDDPVGNIAEMLYVVIIYITVILLISLMGTLLTRIKGDIKRRAVSGILFSGALCLGLFLINSTGWIVMAAQGLPLAMIILFIYAIYILGSFRCSGYKIEELPRTLLLFSMIVFATALLFKIFLRANIFQYGFALAMPASLLLVTMFLYFAPEAFGKRLGGRLYMRWAGAMFMAFCVCAHIIYSKNMLDMKTYPIGSGADTMLMNRAYSASRGEVFNSAISGIEEAIPEGERLAVLPEGVMLNYLMRIKNPTPHINFMPVEFSLFGEGRILRDFKADAPEYIALIDRETGEYGYRLFGRDYANQLYAWIKENYAPVQLFGKEPLTGIGFGIMLLKKRTVNRP